VVKRRLVGTTADIATTALTWPNEVQLIIFGFFEYLSMARSQDEFKAEAEIPDDAPSIVKNCLADKLGKCYRSVTKAFDGNYILFDWYESNDGTKVIFWRIEWPRPKGSFEFK